MRNVGRSYYLVIQNTNMISDAYVVEWADLVTLDLSKFDRPNGKQELASQLKDAVHKVGFFYIVRIPICEGFQRLLRAPVVVWDIR